jgi:Family of unknown function (DUF6510)
VNVLDGNALAGDLGDMFAVDVTAARFICAGCGHADVVAALQVFRQAPGSVGRCPECTEVVICLVKANGRVFLDMRGVARLELPMSDS